MAWSSGRVAAGRSTSRGLCHLRALGARAKPNGKVRMSVDPSLPGPIDTPSLGAALPHGLDHEGFAAVKLQNLGKHNLVSPLGVLSQRAHKYLGCSTLPLVHSAAQLCSPNPRPCSVRSTT